MTMLKMVTGKTYVLPTIFGANRVIAKGEEIEVTDEQAEILLAASYSDGLNNQHFYFAEVGSEAVGEDGKVPSKSRRRAPPVDKK